MKKPLVLLALLYTAPCYAACDSQTSMMLHMNGADQSTTFTDDSPSPLTVTANGTAKIVTAQSKFGGASGLFALSAYLTTTDTAALDFGTGDFTIDFQLRFSTTGTSQRLFGIGTYNSAGICGIFGSNLLSIYINSGVPAYSTAWIPSIDTWYHVAIVRTGTTIKVFIDGTQLGVDLSNSDNLSTTDGVFVSAWNIATADGLSSGWFDEFRVSKGVARWTSNFTAPTSEYCGASVNTSGMLMCFE